MASAVQSRETLTERYAKEFAGSRRLYEQAKGIFPNGVTHDLRYLEPFPIYVDRAKGSRKWDVDGHEIIDYWSGHGAILLGHSHPEVVEAVRTQMERATHPGACHELEIEWGRWVQRLIPSAQKVRFVASGTEATLMALRLARIFTGKPKVLKFAGHFHGWNDFVIPGADPPYDQASLPGIPAEVMGNTVIVPPNDPAVVEGVLGADPQIGCVILEPTGGHFGAVPIRGEFLQTLRDLTARHGCLLIFDEVITGFRVHPGGAQGHYGIKPDLTTLAKILAGGLPGGCLAGREDILAALEFRPGKPKMKHPGTFNANPLSAAAGTTTLRLVADGAPCRRANEMGRLLRQKLNAMFVDRNADWVAYGEFSAFKLLPGYHGPHPGNDDFIPFSGSLDNLDGPKDPALIHAFRRGMLLHGVDLMGLGGMTSAAHTDADITKTVEAVSGTLDCLQDSK
ncbi:MAG TPA: aminotransferase class III-fold pyridoxal phosphate-dependent enzyme [Gemmataceae bacterium]|jgi:glutamate-1-semialdehyde 2,1-aminomutase|nr:aminotransferase class III-fold pyridoxal phosphate-dependent enzyme [Gemmataceae bacterium]